MCRTEAPDALHHRCAAFARDAKTAEKIANFAGIQAERASNREPPIPNPQSPIPLPRRVAPFALAASLVVVVGGAFVYQATEPLLGPIRRVLPPMGGLDWSPFIAIIVLSLVARLFAGL